MSIPLARVFNLSLKEGVVPFEWKEANIIPLFKKGLRNKSENYRPVSLTSVICKLLERLIKDHMVDFLVRHKLLNSSQHGFLKARSCLTNMLCFFEEITKWIVITSRYYLIFGKLLTICHIKDAGCGLTHLWPMGMGRAWNLRAGPGPNIDGLGRAWA